MLSNHSVDRSHRPVDCPCLDGDNERLWQEAITSFADKICKLNRVHMLHSFKQLSRS